MTDMNTRMHYLRVSLLNYCNLSCFYCKPIGKDRRQASTADVTVLIEAIAALHRFGVRKVRFTGGEPTLHNDLTTLVHTTKALSNDTFCAITSNGLGLVDLAQPLADAGIDSVNVSLDTLQSERFKQITGVAGLDRVVAGIRACIGVIPKVKLNCVMMKGVNDDEAAAMVAFADSLGVDVRFIEYMPTRSNATQRDLYIPGDKVKASLPYSLTPVSSPHMVAARYFGAPDLGIKVGFINAVSHSFCAKCDRLRLTSDGNLYGCLFSGQKFNLFELMPQGLESVRQSLRRLLDGKRFLGCPGAAGRTERLPSFIDMGG